ncbi:hypothetical protein [Streptomyces hydrogenans]
MCQTARRTGGPGCTPWTHARIDGTQINGWIYDGNLSNSGALERC